MNNRKLSIKDIAKELNVSPTTISFVLNRKGKEKKISDEVIKKIESYVESVGYKPNLVARSLRTGSTKTLVFMVEDIGNFFFAKIARLIEDIAYKEGYKVLFCSNENDDMRSRELLELFSEMQVDGYIVIPSSGIKNDLSKMIKNNIPLVLFDRYFEDLKTNYVIIDNYEASKNATEHLIENGFKHIAFITTDVQQVQMLNRLKGYKDVVIENDIEPIVLQIPFEETGSKKGKRIMRTFFKENANIDAVFFSTNYLTRNGLEIIKENSEKAALDLGLVAFDDNDLYRINTPSITAIAQPMDDIAKQLMSIMLQLLKKQNKISKAIQIKLKAELIIRTSSLAK
ncbi:LacI family DNA-binding transcriptional regulator [Flavivirga sp. 57AJ16]|uniref:LacI family DNA-binding transcriptional regulator n=1 Tax=Flavivirga sp. 57AJ16 TaxID=3025307 RepID=UPI002365DF57|nr:LacI family DNA-binding transcriptional regulator [Flavivirga sp. 57AJ16]MDD7887542.1 LacI family DNA-binding transcriptional regulator [Flavivirga sp. 57AJ16]